MEGCTCHVDVPSQARDNPPAVGITYRDAGVDIEAGDRFARSLQSLVASTHRAGVAGELGGFGGAFELDMGRYTHPVLISGADGVGTKLRVAFATGRHDTVGIDLVAMCVNDVVTTGADPLFFLDYFATGRLDPGVGLEVVSGIAAGCREAGCALLGGETAEMPGSYSDGEYDLAGFCVGVVERDARLDTRDPELGDSLIGLASSGLHSNGFSLARQVLIEDGALSLEEDPGGLGRSLADELLEPTRIYVRPLLRLLESGAGIRGAAHITGGGLVGNIPRILGPGTGAVLSRGSWSVPPIFALLEAEGDLSREEMDRTFNQGIGMVLAVAPADGAALIDALAAEGLPAVIIGEVVTGDFGCEIR